MIKYTNNIKQSVYNGRAISTNNRSSYNIKEIDFVNPFKWDYILPAYANDIYDTVTSTGKDLFYTGEYKNYVY